MADEGYKLTVRVFFTDLTGFNEQITSSDVKIAGYTGLDLTVTALNDVMTGTIDKDRLNGQDSSDVLFGSVGNNVLIGSKGDDVLIGGTQRDTLTGGKGDDILIGGNGRDTFVFGGSRRDNRTLDFQAGADIIKITKGAGGFGDLTVAQIGDDVLIRYARTSITVTDILVSEITTDDFIF